MTGAGVDALRGFSAEAHNQRGAAGSGGLGF
jgi:hypothetical protein